MRYRNLLLIVFSVFISLDLATTAKMQNAAGPLSLTIGSPKNQYRPGEVVSLTFRLQNQTAKDIVINDLFATGDGSLKLYVSRDGKNYPEYNPGWGEIDFTSLPARSIASHQSLISSSNILWHSKPNALKGQSQDVINDVAKKTLLTDYAFPESGTYLVKAVYDATVESEPIKITIVQPQGEDLKVWSLISDRGDIAYFLYNGYPQIPDHAPDERAKFIQEIEGMIKDHPESFYAKSLQASLDHYLASEANRREFMKNLQPQKPV